MNDKFVSKLRADEKGKERTEHVRAALRFKFLIDSASFSKISPDARARVSERASERERERERLRFSDHGFRDYR